jgi:methylenetetrahydrofolate dehydrogenase (NADP+)/methenyltetrahydrofolate cyclohydrolase
VTAQLIDGRRIAAEVRREVAAEVVSLKASGVTPGLAVLLVGNDPASEIYVRNKKRASQEVGILTEIHRIHRDISQPKLLSIVGALNMDERIHGILVQLPLPNHIDEATVIEAVSPNKDVDGFHPTNLGRLAIGDPQFIPATPYAVIEMLDRHGVEMGGKHAVIVGRSNIVGKPMALAWMHRDSARFPTVTVCHSFDPGVGVYTAQADVLVVAIGSPGAIQRQDVKRGAVIVDIGINRVDAADDPRGYRIVGDVDFEGVADVASAITPVPGGVGPMTVAMLLKNVMQSARRTHERSGHGR